jgi:hypothetical protein
VFATTPTHWDTPSSSAGSTAAVVGAENTRSAMTLITRGGPHGIFTIDGPEAKSFLLRPSYRRWQGVSPMTNGAPITPSSALMTSVAQPTYSTINGDGSASPSVLHSHQFEELLSEAAS